MMALPCECARRVLGTLVLRALLEKLLGGDNVRR